MNIIELARWQWADYPTFHQHRTNRLIHVVAVPLFWLGLALIAYAAWQADWVPLLAGVAVLPVSLGLQGVGHRLEALPPVPFSSPANAMARLLLEQLVSFPRFMLRGFDPRA